MMLTPRLLVPDARTCSLAARSADLGQSPGQELSVSGMLLAGPERAGARGYEPGDPPVRLTPGESHEIVPVTWTVPAG